MFWALHKTSHPPTPQVSQSHPVMLAFIRLLLLCRRQRWAILPLSVGTREVTSARTIKARYARARWHMAFTLINNPDLRLDRHGYRQAMQQGNISGLIKFPKTDTFVQVDTAYQQALQWARKEGVREKSANTCQLVNKELFETLVKRRYLGWKNRYGGHSFNKMNKVSKRIRRKKCSDIVKRTNEMYIVIKAAEIRKEEEDEKEKQRTADDQRRVEIPDETNY